MFRLTVILSALVLAACSSVTSDGFYKARTSHKLTPDNVHLDEFAYTSPDPYGWLYKDNDYIYRGTPVGDVGERRTRRPFGQFQEPYPSLVVPNRSMIYGAGAKAAQEDWASRRDAELGYRSAGVPSKEVRMILVGIQRRGR